MCESSSGVVKLLILPGIILDMLVNSDIHNDGTYHCPVLLYVVENNIIISLVLLTARFYCCIQGGP